MPHNLFVLPIVALILIVTLAIVLKILQARPAQDAKTDVYYLKKSLFSVTERSFLGVLESLEMSEYRIMAKVRLADIFGIKKGHGWQSAFNRINAKHVDFLLVRQSDGAPILGIELDDSSHDEPDRKERDKFVDTVFNSAGLPILRVPARQTYEAKAIKDKIQISLIEVKETRL